MNEEGEELDRTIAGAVHKDRRAEKPHSVVLARGNKNQ
jgi:hypothetical protein